MGNVTESTLVDVFVTIFLCAAFIRLMSDDANHPERGIVTHEGNGGFVELNRGRSELEGPLHPGDDRNHQDAENEQ